MTDIPRHGVNRPDNVLLSALPDDDFLRIRPALETVPLRVRQLLQKQREPISYVYFPNRGVASVSAVLSTGAMVEVLTIGNEGIVGVEGAFTADPRSSGEAVIQIADVTASAERMRLDDFRCELLRGGALRDMIGEYVQAQFAAVFQVAGCNALHLLPQRCARWLLTTHDRMQVREFDLSHELMAMMLGVSRQTVTRVAGALQRDGAIAYRHGRMQLLDRSRLEASCCECYGIIRGAFGRLENLCRSVA
jgi:CRP-like cAMP-binding protein